jgi:hypothetical protein
VDDEVYNFLPGAHIILQSLANGGGWNLASLFALIILQEPVFFHSLVKWGAFVNWKGMLFCEPLPPSKFHLCFILNLGLCFQLLTTALWFWALCHICTCKQACMCIVLTSCLFKRCESLVTNAVSFFVDVIFFPPVLNLVPTILPLLSVWWFSPLAMVIEASHGISLKEINSVFF